MVSGSHASETSETPQRAPAPSIDVLTIFPEYLEPLRHALVGKALDRGLLHLTVHNLRRWTSDVHQAVDDSPYGGGPGMVMKPEVWGPALDEVCAPAPDGEPPVLVVPSPAGELFTQHSASWLANQPRVVFGCGRYEGIDERVLIDARRRLTVVEYSLGDYVLVGGEAAVLVMVEAMARLLPGVLGNPASAQQDSFSDGLLEGPSYTRPERWRELAVPEVLRSGNHAAVDRWRRDEALRRTAGRRPELLTGPSAPALDARDWQVLAEFGLAQDG